jgi:hypothetical protein
MTYTTEHNANRGFRRVFPHLSDLSNEMIRADFLDLVAGGYVHNLEAVADHENGRFGEASMTPRVEGVPMLRRSIKPKGATVRARQFFASLPVGTPRREALDAAVRSGIAFYTARTQYQAFRAAA